MPSSAPGSCLHPWRGLYANLGRKVLAPKRTAKIHTFRARAASMHIPAGHGSHHRYGGPTAGVKDLRTFGHVDLPRLVARGGLISCPVRGSCFTAIATKEPEGSSRRPP